MKSFWGIALVLAFAVFAESSYAQFNTASVNGSIGTNEYGSHTNGQNMYQNGSMNWYATWDNDSLYIGVENVTVASDHHNVIYIDFNPVDTLPDINLNAKGTTTGFNYDNVVMDPTFRADFVVYFKSGYNEYRRADSSGSWTSNVSNRLVYANSSTGTNQNEEIAIPWNIITNGAGRPSSFIWTGFRQRNSGGSVASFQDFPSENTDISGSSSSAQNGYISRYFIVETTSNGSATKPFSLNCYIHPTNASGSVNFDDLSVYNFTMNQSGKTIVKNNNKIFNINGLLQVQQGTLDLGNSNTSYNDTITKNLRIGPNGTLTLSTGTANIYCKNNFYNYGTFNANGSIVGFIGTAAAQNIVGYLDKGNALARLQISNPNGLVAFPVDSIAINDDLILDTGKLVISSNYLKLRNTATCSPAGGKQNVYVDGVIFWESFGTTIRKFPSGNGNQWGQMHITPQNADSRGTPLRQYRVKYNSTPYGTYTLASQNPQLDHVSFKEYWDLSETTGATGSDKSCKIKLFWTSFSEVANSSAKKDSLLVCHWGGSDWSWYQSLNTVDWFSQDSGSVESDNVSSFSPVTIGSITPDHPLPVTLISLTAGRLNETTAIVNWKTASEFNNSGFEVQRSADAKIWQYIGFVHSATVTTQIPQNYQLADNSLPEGVVYYRLLQKDLDGKTSVYGPVALHADLPVLNIYPNPARQDLSLQTNLLPQTLQNIEITNTLGQKVAEYSFTENLKLALPAGCYYLIISTTGQEKIVKKLTIVD